MVVAHGIARVDGIPGGDDQGHRQRHKVVRPEVAILHRQLRPVRNAEIAGSCLRHAIGNRIGRVWAGNAARVVGGRGKTSANRMRRPVNSSVRPQEYAVIEIVAWGYCIGGIQLAGRGSIRIAPDDLNLGRILDVDTQAIGRCRAAGGV